MRRLSLSLVLFGVWLLFSGHYTPLVVALGVLSCGLVVVIAGRMGVIDAEGHPIEHARRSFGYLPWLFKEIAKANLSVARRILNPRLPINPRLIRVSTSQRSELGRVIYANSITLTPGTVSIRIEGDQILVHALDDEFAADLESGEMDRRVAHLEGGR